MADNKDKKVLKSSIERELSQTCLNSAEREKIKGSTNLNVPHLRFPEFRGEWEEHKLCHIASIVGRIGFRGYTTNDIVAKGEGAIALSPTNIENNKLTYDKDNTYISFYKYEESPEIMIKKGDVIFVKTGSTVGKVAYVDKLICKTTLNPQVVVLKNIQCNSYLLSVLLSTNRFQNAIKKITVGGAVPTLSQAAMGNIAVIMPKVAEQEKLSKFISLLDERIATQNKIIEKMESLIKGLSQRLLSPKQGWTSYKLDELCQIKSGYSGIQVSFQTAYKVSRIETISNHCINMSRIGFVKEIPQEYKLSVGDILFSNINSVQYIGNTAFIDKDYGLYHGMNLLRIVPDSRIVFPRFIHLLLCSERLLRHFQSICNKAVSQASINQTSLGKTIITIPSYKEQQHICSIIESVERKLDIETSLLKMLQYQKQYLLRQMFI